MRLSLIFLSFSIAFIACNETPKTPATPETVKEIVPLTKVNIGGKEFSFTAKEVTNFKPGNTKKVQVFVQFETDTLLAYGVYTGEDGKTSDYELYKIPVKGVAPDSYISKEDVEYPKATVNKFYLKAKAGSSFIRTLHDASNGSSTTADITETEFVIMDSAYTNKAASLMGIKQ